MATPQTLAPPPVTGFIKKKGWDQTAAKYNGAAGHTSAKGTGSLTHLLSSRFPILPILATDISPSMLDRRTHNTPPSPKSNISTKTVDMNNPFASLGMEAEGGFSHVFCTIALHLIEDPARDKILSKWARLLRPSGLLCIAIWDVRMVKVLGR
ncbi:hypothetical protein B0J14DRAFT_655936 [Halenospora varia]|nr:hypothetical protein B0J14DRAFT_655936 [Halenospora varia]